MGRIGFFILLTAVFGSTVHARNFPSVVIDCISFNYAKVDRVRLVQSSSSATDFFWQFDRTADDGQMVQEVVSVIGMGVADRLRARSTSIDPAVRYPRIGAERWWWFSGKVANGNFLYAAVNGDKDQYDQTGFPYSAVVERTLSLDSVPAVRSTPPGATRPARERQEAGCQVLELDALPKLTILPAQQ